MAARVLLTAALVLNSLGCGKRMRSGRGSAAYWPRSGSRLAARRVHTHASHGGTRDRDLVHGMVAGLIGFATFCLVITVALEPLGTIAAFGFGMIFTTLAADAAALPRLWRSNRSRPALCEQFQQGSDARARRVLHDVHSP